jgi:hypothetical protein
MRQQRKNIYNSKGHVNVIIAVSGANSISWNGYGQKHIATIQYEIH